METTLNRLHEGQSAMIKELCVTGALRRRLLDFGMIQGTQVACLRKSPLGSPVIYLLRGTMLAIRATDGAQIRVEAEECA